MNIDNITNARLQNWNNFCQYHLGDWHGVWTRYSASGEIIESFKCIRSFHLSSISSQVNQENSYTYADGRTEKKTFPPHDRDTTKALFLDNSFSFGSTKVESNAVFGFETALKSEDRRISAAVIYDKSSKLQRLTVIVEQLASFPSETIDFAANAVTMDKSTWQGTQRLITSDLIRSSPKSTKWKKIEDLGDDYLLILHPGGVSVSCPRQLKSEKEFMLVVDWRVNNTLSKRGIRYFDTLGFTSFILEVFTQTP